MALEPPLARAAQSSRDATGPAVGFVTFLLGDMTNSPGKYLATAAVVLVFLLLAQFATPKLDPREPPLIKPAFPVIGHIIGLISQEGNFFPNLYQKHNKFPIGTLPMGDKKVYMINSPSLFQAALKSKSLSFDPFVIEFAKKSCGVSTRVFRPVLAPGMLADFTAVIQSAMVPEHLLRMNMAALSYIGKNLSAVGSSRAPQEVHVESLYLWIRDLLTTATTEALYGQKNPFRGNPELIEDIWAYDAGLFGFIIHPFPRLAVPRTFRARANIQAVLCSFYNAGNDANPDVSRIVTARAEALRRWGVKNEHIGLLEIALLHVSIANTIPTAFWFFAQVFSRPELVEKLQEEVLQLVEFTRGKDGDRIASVNIALLDANAPLLTSCYREAIRCANTQTGSRRVMTDTVLSDTEGNSYLLKAGSDVQIPSGIAHRMPEVWGPDADSFRADRFVGLLAQAPRIEDSRRKRAAYIPFGGGKHLCPGRNFAFAENLGFIAAMVLGFDVRNRDGGPICVPERGATSLASGVSKPVDEKKISASISRRKGWEDVEWRFYC